VVRISTLGGEGAGSALRGGAAAIRSALSKRLSPEHANPEHMQHLIIRGDPDIRKDAVIEHDGEELVCFGINVQGGWHGPDEPQLWCTVGTEDEREAYDKREYVPHWLDVETVDAEDLDVIKAKGDLSV
jgi:hypothetical protein